MKKWIPGYEGSYKVTKKGRVVSYCKKEPAIKCWWVNNTGRPCVSLYKDGKCKHWLVYHLVLMAHKESRPKGTEAMHLDGNPMNCNLSNLAWGSHVCNEAFKVDHGTVVKGKHVQGAKLTKKKVRLMRKLYNAGGITQRELAELFGISAANVHHVVTRKSWRHVK